MNFRSLALAAATISLLSGAALAQEGEDQSSSTTGSVEKSTALDQAQRQMRAPFYTDDTMATMRTGDEFSAAWTAMSADDQQSIRDQCANSTSPEDEFCRGIENIQNQ
jgi:hypothetical protein